MTKAWVRKSYQHFSSQFLRKGNIILMKIATRYNLDSCVLAYGLLILNAWCKLSNTPKRQKIEDNNGSQTNTAKTTPLSIQKSEDMESFFIFSTVYFLSEINGFTPEQQDKMNTNKLKAQMRKVVIYFTFYRSYLFLNFILRFKLKLMDWLWTSGNLGSEHCKTNLVNHISLIYQSLFLRRGKERLYILPGMKSSLSLKQLILTR